MNLTAQQVRERLHIGETRLKKLVSEGTLKPINSRREGAKKFFMKFRQSDVVAVAKELKVRNSPAKPSQTPTPLGQLAGFWDSEPDGPHRGEARLLD